MDHTPNSRFENGSTPGADGRMTLCCPCAMLGPPLIPKLDGEIVGTSTNWPHHLVEATTYWLLVHGLRDL